MENSSDAAAGLFALSMLGFSSLFGIAYMCFSIIMCLFMIASIAGWIVMLVDVAQRDEKKFPGDSKDQKTLWLLIVLLGGWIGALVYYLLVYQKMKNGKA